MNLELYYKLAVQNNYSRGIATLKIIKSAVTCILPPLVQFSAPLALMYLSKAITLSNQIESALERVVYLGSMYFSFLLVVKVLWGLISYNIRRYGKAKN